MRAYEPGFAVADDDITLRQLGVAGPEALDLPALEYETCLEIGIDKVVVPRLAVDGDDISSRLFGLFAAHSRRRL